MAPEGVDWGNVISAQCSECQREEIQKNADKRQK